MSDNYPARLQRLNHQKVFSFVHLHLEREVPDGKTGIYDLKSDHWREGMPYHKILVAVRDKENRGSTVTVIVYEGAKWDDGEKLKLETFSFEIHEEHHIHDEKLIDDLDEDDEGGREEYKKAS